MSGSTKESPATDKILIPDWVSKIRIVETDFEESFIDSLTFDGRNVIDSPIHLTRGDTFEFPISGPGILGVAGKYVANIPIPQNYLQLRQKISLRLEYERTNLAHEN